MRDLRRALLPFVGRGAGIRIEHKNRMFVTGLHFTDAVSLKNNKPLLALILPENQSFKIRAIVESLNRMIEYSDQLIIDGGYELHTADIKALPFGRAYLESLEVS